MHDDSGGAVFGVADSKAESLERSIELIRRPSAIVNRNGDTDLLIEPIERKNY